MTSPLTITAGASAIPAAKAVSELDGVACPRVNLCLAVGEVFGSQRERALAEVWNGRHWRAVAAPSIPDGQDSSLNDVTCSSATNCLAVGSTVKTTTSGSVSHGLIADWKGKSWKVRHLAIPSGDALTNLSCVQGTCMITGFRQTSSAEPRPVILQLRGTKIRSLKPAQPRGQTFAILRGVSCVRPSSCLAVGESGVSPTGQSPTDLAETWNGKRWRIAKIPQPKAAVALLGVSCPDSSTCLAAGWPAAIGAGRPTNLTLLERDGHWHRLLPSGGKPSGGFGTPPLEGVSCASPTSCVAVGSSGGQGAEIWNGSKLRFVTVPGPIQQILSDVSCASAKRCVAVGRNGTSAVAVLWNGKNWKRLPVA